MNASKKILLVEDDPSFGGALKDYLLMNNYQVTHALDGEEGWKLFKGESYDVCIFDVMMPKKDGFTLAKEVRKKDMDIPIIFLTAKSLKEDVLKGYKVGADDYVIKPFDSEVLLYKINVVLQRHNKVNGKESIDFEQENFQMGAFQLNSKLRLLKINNEEIKLSPKESELLKLLCIFKDDLMPRELALTRIWHDDNYFTSRSMDVYITKLRKYLKPDESVEIENIHGEGFRLMIKS